MRGQKLESQVGGSTFPRRLKQSRINKTTLNGDLQLSSTLPGTPLLSEDKRNVVLGFLLKKFPPSATELMLPVQDPFLPWKAGMFHGKPVSFSIYKCFQTSVPDTGIRSLDFSCMTLDTCCPCSQWSGETQGWTESCLHRATQPSVESSGWLPSSLR